MKDNAGYFVLTGSWCINTVAQGIPLQSGREALVLYGGSV